MSSPRILIIDDDQIVCRTLEGFLTDEGYDVQTAYSGESAIEMLQQHKFDLCIVDMRLPKMDGNALIIESNKQFPDIKYIIHTGSMSYSPPKQIKEIGITEELIFKKPIKNLNKLIETIQSIIESKDG